MSQSASAATSVSSSRDSTRITQVRKMRCRPLAAFMTSKALRDHPHVLWPLLLGQRVPNAVDVGGVDPLDVVQRFGDGDVYVHLILRLGFEQSQALLRVMCIHGGHSLDDASSHVGVPAQGVVVVPQDGGQAERSFGVELHEGGEGLGHAAAQLPRQASAFQGGE